METYKLILTNRIAISLFNSLVDTTGLFKPETYETITGVISEFYPTDNMMSRTLIENYAEFKKLDDTGLRELNQHMAYIYPKETSVELEIKAGNFDNNVHVSLNFLPTGEFNKKLAKLLNTDIALSEVNVDLIVDYIVLEKDMFNIDDIKIKEIKFGVMAKLNILPADPEELLLYIVNKTTSSKILIKSPEILNGLKDYSYVAIDIIKKYLGSSSEGYELLGSVFHRHKKIFMAIKSGLDATNTINRGIINKIRRRADRYHKPIVKPLYQRVLSEHINIFDLENLLKDLDTTYLIKILKGAYYRISAIRVGVKYARYNIRNGLSYIDTFSDTLDINEYIIIANNITSILSKRISDNVAKNNIVFTNSSCVDINLGLPVSGKQMVGNLPYGTTIKYKNTSDVMLGIYWTEKDRDDNATIDLDLSVVSKTLKLGWDGEHNDNDDNMLFSGDVISAPNGASEVIYISDMQPSEIFEVKVSNFNAIPNAEYTLVLANNKVDKKDFKKSFHIKQEDRIYSTKLKFDCGVNTMKVGTLQVYENATYLTISGSGNKSSYSESLGDIERTISEIENMSNAMLSDVYGVEIVDENSIDDPTVKVIDVSNPDINNLLLLVK